MLALVFLLTSSVFAGPENYIFSANKGLLYIKVYKADTLASAAAHNHAIEAVGWSGKATWDGQDVSSCSIKITVPVNNLYVDKTSTRAKAGLKGEVSDSQRKDIQKNMLAKGQLNVEKYPWITFQSTSCTASGDKVTLNGEFSLRGVTKKITVPLRVSEDNGLQLQGSFSIKATDYGFEPYSVGFGAIANEDKMDVHLDLYAEKK